MTNNNNFKQFKKKFILVSSATILIALTSINTIKAQEVSDFRETEQSDIRSAQLEQGAVRELTSEEVSDDNAESLLQNVLELIPEKKREALKLFITDENQKNLLLEALVHHKNENYELATKNYNKLIENNEILDDTSRDLILIIAKVAESHLPLSKDNIEVLLTLESTTKNKDIEETEKNNQQKVMEEKAPKEEDSGNKVDKLVVEEESTVEQHTGNSKVIQSLDSPDTLYTQLMSSNSVSERWNLAQKFVDTYPNDKRATEALNFAANSQINYAERLHRNKDYKSAVIYYERILSTPLINDSIQLRAKLNLSQSKNQQELLTSDILYTQLMSSGSVSQRWSFAQKFIEYFGNDSRAKDAVNFAANSQINYAERLHKNKDYTSAAIYYERILSTPLISDAIQERAELNLQQANNKSELITADNLYIKLMASSSVSERWNLAQDFIRYFANDSRAEGAVNFAANSQINYAERLHRNKDYSSAIVYYERILSTPLINDSTQQRAQLNLDQAKGQSELLTADSLYTQLMSSGSISQRWNLAHDFVELFPNDSRATEAIRYAATSQLNFGVRMHRQNNYSDAIVYYGRVLSSNLIDNKLRNNANNYMNLAKNNQTLKTATEFYNETMRAQSASMRWGIVTEGLSVYPNDAKLLTALNSTAYNNLNLGRRLHTNGDLQGARVYYNRVLNEEKVSERTRHLAKIFLNQTDFNHQKVVYIDPGHGGSDGGAIAGGIREKDLNLSVAKELQSTLEKRGYKVILSRSTDATVGLSNRPQEANLKEADIFVSVHFNSMGTSNAGSARGIETFIYHRVASGFGQEPDRNKFGTDDPRIKESLTLADAMQANLIRQTGLSNRGVKGQNFNVIRNTHIPAVLVELGFMDNSKELSIIKTNSYHQKAANAMADGIDNYFSKIK